MKNIVTAPFSPWEIILGWCYLAFQQLLLGNILFSLNRALGLALSLAEINIVFFCVNFVCSVVLLRKVIVRAHKVWMENLLPTLLTALSATLLIRVAGRFLGVLILVLQPEFPNVNDAAVQDMLNDSTVLMSLCTVFLVPFAEELLFRGFVFGVIHRRNRWLAYAVSTFLFSLVHILTFIGQVEPVTLLLCFLQYIPSGMLLAWAYERTDSIYTPILAHATLNLMGMIPWS